MNEQPPVVWLDDVTAWLDDPTLSDTERHTLEGIQAGLVAAGLPAVTLSGPSATDVARHLAMADDGRISLAPEARRYMTWLALLIDGVQLDSPSITAHRERLARTVEALHQQHADDDASLITGQHLLGCLHGYRETWDGDAHRLPEDPPRLLTWAERQAAADVTERMITLDPAMTPLARAYFAGIARGLRDLEPHPDYLNLPRYGS